MYKVEILSNLKGFMKPIYVKSSWLMDIIDNDQAAIYVKDMEGRYVLFNEKCENITGIPREKALGKTDEELYGPDTAKEFVKNDKKVLELKTPINVEERSVMRGREYTMMATKFPLFNDTGDIAAVCGISTDITSLKETEAKVKDALRIVNETNLNTQNLINSVPGVVWELHETNDNRKFTVHFISQYLEAMTGYSVSDLTNGAYSFLDLFHPEDREKFISEKEYLYKNENKKIYQYRWIKKTGEVMYVDFHTHEILDDNANPIGMRGVSIDVTERQRIKSELERLAAIVQSSEDAIIGTDPHGVITDWNLGAEKLYGYKKGEIIGKNVAILEPASLNEHSIVERILNGEVIEHYETVRRRADGSVIDVSISVSPIKDTRGNIIGLSKISRDITEMKKTQKDLIDSETRLKKVINANVIGVLFWDNTGRITEANDTFLKMLAYTREEFSSKKLRLRDILVDGTVTHARKLLADVKTTGIIAQSELEIYNKDGYKVPVLIAGTSFYDNHSSGVAFVLDITEQKDLEKKKDDFISVASHELKTPITSMKIYAQMLKRKISARGDEEEIKYAEKIDDQIDKLSELVRELLDISRIDSSKLVLNKEEFSLERLVKNIAKDMQETVSKHSITVTGEIPVKIYADKQRIIQVLINLITNAIKYSPNEKEIIIKLWVDKKNAYVAVQDFGIGISKKNQTNLFSRFFRVSGASERTYPGLGIGLYVSKEMMRLHNGNIWVESKKGKGSTFTISLPLKEKLV